MTNEFGYLAETKPQTSTIILKPYSGRISYQVLYQVVRLSCRIISHKPAKKNLPDFGVPISWGKFSYSALLLEHWSVNAAKNVSRGCASP
jgi:hypothetical protein